jgi:hypothetical protein
MRLMIFPRTLRRPNQAHGHVISAAAINPRSEGHPRKPLTLRWP